MPRIIQGWNSGQKIEPLDMQNVTSTTAVESTSSGMDNLPCIYNGLKLVSQTGSQNSIVTFSPGTVRCLDIPQNQGSYNLPTSSLTSTYPCYMDFNTSPDANVVITLLNSLSFSIGFIVATFTISPNTSNAILYTVTGVLQQIQQSDYDPTIHVKLCSWLFTGTTFALNFNAQAGNRDNDLTGLAALQFDYQANNVVLDTPPSQGSPANQVYIPTLPFFPQGGIIGSRIGSAPGAGFIGQRIESAIQLPSFFNVPSATTWANMTTISLPAGIYILTSMVMPASTIDRIMLHIGTTTSSGSSNPTDASAGYNLMSLENPGVSNILSLSISALWINLSSTTTYYMNVWLNPGSTHVNGRITAVRIA